ncbi:MAG: FGGY family carbohydrate kinase [Bacteroidota bacterium]
MYLLGYDIGSSSIKAALFDSATGQSVGLAQHPRQEMAISAPQEGWAEQDPEMWWKHLCLATRELLQQTQVDPQRIAGIGIAYQMHGLVLVDAQQKVLRPSIIWCDSRAVEIGRSAFQALGEQNCLRQLLNSPGNFTASKLKWVKDNEPEIYERIDKIMLPGDYIAMRLSGAICTTITGLSEGMFWDFEKEQLSELIMDHYGLEASHIPELRPALGLQGQLTEAAAAQTGLRLGTPICYRAGDQPNNALSLGVLHPGEVAATGGTSGVVYGLVDQPTYDPRSRVNGFAHINHQPGLPRIGILLCINGAGSQYRWVKQNMSREGLSYDDLEGQLATIPVGAEGLRMLPFGNGAERMLEDRALGAQINNLQFNRHGQPHCYRAALEGIAFSFVYGMQIMQQMGLNLEVMRVGNDNLFRSSTFATTIASLLGSRIEMMATTGALGAARAAGVAVGIYNTIEEATQNNQLDTTYWPAASTQHYQAAYDSWLEDLHHILNHSIASQYLKPGSI